MLDPTPKTLLEAIDMCKHLPRSEILYQCLKPYWHGNPESFRSVDEVLIRSLGIHIVAISAYGHLLSLQGATNIKSSKLAFYCLLFYFFPLLPLIQCVHRLITLICRAFQHKNPSFRQCIAAFLGTHASLTPNPGRFISLIEVESTTVQPKFKEYNALWAGRFALLLAVVVQFLSTFVLGFRRDIFYKDVTKTWAVDNINTSLAIGGFVSTMNSLLITVLNTDWIVAEGHTQELWVHEMSSSSVSMNDREQSDEVIIRPEANNQKGICVRAFLRLRRINAASSKRLTSLHSASLQWDVEISFLLLGIITPLGQRTYLRAKDPCLSVWKFLLSTGDPRSCNNFDYGYAQIPWLKYETREMKGILFLATIYYVPYIRIFLRIGSWLTIQSRILNHVPEKARAFIGQVHSCLLSDCNLVGIFCNLLMLLPFTLQMIFIADDIRFMKGQERLFLDNETDNLSKMALGLWLWKDPWQDNMYVI